LLHPGNRDRPNGFWRKKRDDAKRTKISLTESTEFTEEELSCSSHRKMPMGEKRLKTGRASILGLSASGSFSKAVSFVDEPSTRKCKLQKVN
jgi:hypothetical protein